MATFRYTITAEDAGTEIQHFLRFRQGISRKVVISLKHLPEGILRNGTHARTIDLLQEGDLLQITLPESSRRLPPCEADVPRLYWDDDVAVFNKPAGMPVHQSGGHIFGTLASVYATLCEKEGAPGTFRAVNRIDKDTTGAVVVARHQIAAGKLWKGVAKRYVAIVSGVPTPAGGLIDLPLEREIPLEMKRIVSPDGERAVTEYRVLAVAADGSCALVGFILHTGRPTRSGCIWRKRAGRCWATSCTAAPPTASPGRRCTAPGSSSLTPLPGSSCALPLPCRRIWPPCWSKRASTGSPCLPRL